MISAQKHTSLGFSLLGAGHSCGSSRGGALAELMNKQDPWARAWKTENEKAHVAQPMCTYFHKGTENCSFEMAAPQCTSNSEANAPGKPSASAGTYLLLLCHWLAPSSWQHGSFPSLLWSSTSWEKPWEAERQEPSTFPGIPVLFSDKRSQWLDSIWKELRNGYSLGQRKHDKRKDNSHHHRKGWKNFFVRHQYRRTRQMVGVVPSGIKPIKHLHVPPKPGKGGGLSRQLIESTAWERKWDSACVVSFFILNEET